MCDRDVSHRKKQAGFLDFDGLMQLAAIVKPTWVCLCVFARGSCVRVTPPLKVGHTPVFQMDSRARFSDCKSPSRRFHNPISPLTYCFP